MCVYSTVYLRSFKSTKRNSRLDKLRKVMVLAPIGYS